jgi:hypothetical protein
MGSLNSGSVLRLLARISFCAFLFVFTANASQLILNGSFSGGLFTNWTLTNDHNSGGSFFAQNTKPTPLTGNDTVGASAGNTYFAVSDAYGNGPHALTQTFTAPLGAGIVEILSFSIFVNDLYGSSGLGGQVDLLSTESDPLLGAPLAIFYSADTAEVGGAPNPYVDFTMDITSYLTQGATYQLRFLQSDWTGPINVGVDSVSLTANGPSPAPAPEPATLIPLSLLLSGFIATRVRRKIRGN